MSDLVHTERADPLEGVRGSWAARATERLRQSGERTASLRSSITSAREHLAAYQASDHVSGLGSPGASSIATVSPLHSPVKSGHTNTRPLAPCSPTTEQLISQSAILHRTMQEQASLLRAQQDKLTALSRRVLKHKGQPPPKPSPTSHLSPPPLHGAFPGDTRHRSHHVTNDEPTHDIHTLRNSASSSHGGFTVRRSSRSANESTNHSATAAVASDVHQIHAPGRSNGARAAAPDRMSDMHVRHEQVTAIVGHSRSCGTSGPHAVDAGQSQPENHMHGAQRTAASDGTGGYPPPGFHVRDNSSAPRHAPPEHQRGPSYHLGGTIPAVNLPHDPGSRDLHAEHARAHAKLSAASVHSSHPGHPTQGPTSNSGVAPPHLTHGVHSSYPMHAAPSAPSGRLYPSGAYTHPHQQSASSLLAGIPPSIQEPSSGLMHPSLQSAPLPGGCAASGRFSHPAAPQPQPPQTNVQSAVSELLQTLSETRQRHAAAVQSMHGHSIANFQPILREQHTRAEDPIGHAPPPLASESSGLRAVQHPVVQSVITQLVSSIANTNSNAEKDVPKAAAATDVFLQRGEHSHSLPAVATEERFRDIRGVPTHGHRMATQFSAAAAGDGDRHTQKHQRGARNAAPYRFDSVPAQHRAGSQGAREGGGGDGEPKASARDASRHRNFLSVHDLRPAYSDACWENNDSKESVNPLRSWENTAGDEQYGMHQSSSNDSAHIRVGEDAKGGLKRGLGQRKKAGWNGNVGVPWSEAELRGKGAQKIPPIGGWGSGYGHNNAADADPLRLFKASTKGVGVPLRREGNMHDPHAPTLGKRGRERGGPGITDVPLKAHTARSNRVPGHTSKDAQKNKFTVHRAGGLRKGKGGWSLKKQPNAGDFAGDPILEGESTVLSAGEEESGCESERDSDFGDETGGVVWEEQDAVRAAAHALHARGAAPTAGDAVEILEAQLREAVNAAKAENTERYAHAGNSLGSVRSEDHHEARLHSTTTHTSSPTDTNLSASEAPTRSTEPPPAAWHRLEELESRVDALVSRMHEPHARKPSKTAQRNTRPPHVSPQRTQQNHRQQEPYTPDGRAAERSSGIRPAHVQNLTEKLSEIELAEKAIFDRWFTPDGAPRKTPLSLPLGNTSQKSRNLPSQQAQHAERSATAHTAQPSRHVPSAVPNSHAYTAGCTGQENNDSMNKQPSRAVHHSVQHTESAPTANSMDPSDMHADLHRVPDGMHSVTPGKQARPSVDSPTTVHAMNNAHENEAANDASIAGDLPMHAVQPEVLGRTDTLASAYTACTDNISEWGIPGGQTSRNILRRTPLCMHGPKDVCAHCIGNTPRRPGHEASRDYEGVRRGAGSPYVSPVNNMDTARAAETAELFTKSEVENIIATRDEFTSTRLAKEAKYLLAGGCNLQTIASQSQDTNPAQSQCMPGMNQSVFVAAVETMADSVIDAVLEEQVDVMLAAVDSAAARIVVEECADQFADDVISGAGVV